MKMLKKLLALAACMLLLVGTPACGGGCSSCGSCDRPVKRTRVYEDDVVVREERVVRPVRRARVAGRRAARREVRRTAPVRVEAETEVEYETEME